MDTGLPPVRRLPIPTLALPPLTPPYKGGERKGKSVNELLNTYRDDINKQRPDPAILQGG